MQKKLLVISMALMLAVLLGCGDLSDDDSAPARRATTRYETVPYRSSARAADGNPYVLIESYKSHDNTKYYYLYYLGYVKGVPIIYKSAVEYNGVTPMTITYEEGFSVTDSVEHAVESSRTHSVSVSAGMTVSMKTGVEMSIPGVTKATVEMGMEARVDSSYTTGWSTSDTYTTANSRMKSESESISATIGGNGEPSGKYRYALFSITDVYAIFVVNPVTWEITSRELVNCARSNTYIWALDYEPDINGEFGKTGKGDLLTFPDITFTAADTPTMTLASPTPPVPEPDPPRTEYKKTYTEQKVVKDNQAWYDFFESDLDLEELKRLGYSYIEIQVDFTVRSIDDGYVNLFVYPEHVTTFTTNGSGAWGWIYEKKSSSPNLIAPIDPGNETSDFYYSKKMVQQVPFSSYASQKFTVCWDASGSGSDDYYLKSRTATVRAK